MTTERFSKRKRAKDERLTTKGPKDPPTKLQTKVTHWLRKNCPIKKTKFLHAHVVEYFTASKAIDALLNDSPWASSKVQNPENAALVFNTREQCVAYMSDLLNHKMFHRARKIPVGDKPSKKKVTAKGDEKGGSGGEEGGAPGTPAGIEKKKKRKIRLDMHLDQVFLDGSDAYVWLYDPISWYYWAGGSVIVLGTIAVCLFPLWPPSMRTGVHYLSLAAAGFLLLIMAIAVLKYALFAALFLLSGGHLSFWLFPNLSEDVGFFESFVPLYDYTYTGKSFLSSRGKRKKAKVSDDEESDDEEPCQDDGDKAEEDEDEKANNADRSESEESSSKKSSTDKDFEMVEKNDTEEDD